jgi:hypothetical protein
VRPVSPLYVATRQEWQHTPSRENEPGPGRGSWPLFDCEESNEIDPSQLQDTNDGC